MYSTYLLPFMLFTANAQLNALAKAAGLKYFGTATDNSEMTDTAYATVLKNISEFGQITPANSMKWDSIEPEDGTFSFTAGDAIANLAKTDDQLIRCHNLVWYNQLPSWVSSGTWSNETLVAALKAHIVGEVTHYKGQCYAWDVVNEALNDDGTYRSDVFLTTIGPEYINIAFQTAAETDPNVKLYYNDYNTENPGPKATAALNIVKSLKAAGLKIDGVGFQGHFIVGETPSKADLVSTLEAFTAEGVEVAYTELDIRMTLPSTDAMLAQQTTDYSTVTSACLATTNCIGITVWDFDDSYSWVPSTFSGQGAACLFDANLNRKPAYYGVAATLAAGAVNGTTPTNTTSPISTKMRGRNYPYYMH